MIEGLCVAKVLKRLRVHVVHAEGGDVVPARHQVGVRDVAVVLHQPDPLLELRVDDAPALTGVRGRLQDPRRVDAVPVGVVAGRGDPRARGDGQDRRGGRRGRGRRAGRVAGGRRAPSGLAGRVARGRPATRVGRRGGRGLGGGRIGRGRERGGRRRPAGSGRRVRARRLGQRRRTGGQRHDHQRCERRGPARPPPHGGQGRCYVVGAARTTPTDTSSSDSVRSRVTIPPAARRSSSPRLMADRKSAGPATCSRSTGDRWDSLASVLARRTRARTSPTASSTAGSAGSLGATSAGVGHAARWIEPSCHQLQTSSVTNGMIGAKSRCSASRARRSAAMAEPAAASPRAP